MTEQQPVEGTPATPAPAAPAEGSQAAPPTRTAEEVEAEYKARLSGKDRAHAAEVAALRAQLESTQGHAQTATQQQEAAGDEVAALKRQLAEAQKVNAQTKQEYEQTLRSTKYPFAAEALDPQTLATMDEAKLAGLDARLKPSAPPVPVDPNTPQGGAPAPKPTSEMSSKELKAELARQSGTFAEELRNR
mgnify:CR=1 FL=1